MPLKTYPIFFVFQFLASVAIPAQITDTLTLDWEALPGIPNRTFAAPLLSTVNAVRDDFFEKTLNVNVFPNPAGGEFFIEMDLPKTMEMSIEVVDILGRRVAVVSKNEVFQSGKQLIKIDVSGWLSGIYLLNFQSEGHSFFKKIIKN